MSKKPAKRSTTAEKVSAVEIATRREEQTLRRLRGQQRRIVALARDLKRAVRRADVERLAAARELCADTGWDLFLVAEITSRERELADARAAAANLAKRVDDLEARFAVVPA